MTKAEENSCEKVENLAVNVLCTCSNCTVTTQSHKVSALGLRLCFFWFVFLTAEVNQTQGAASAVSVSLSETKAAKRCHVTSWCKVLLENEVFKSERMEKYAFILSSTNNC